jgi:hypothetical protein
MTTIAVFASFDLMGFDMFASGAIPVMAQQPPTITDRLFALRNSCQIEKSDLECVTTVAPLKSITCASSFARANSPS